jgi:hypothetical protein
MDGRKLTFEKYFVEHRGQEALDRLWEMARNVELYKAVRRTNGKGDIADYFKATHEYMLKIRAEGFKGWVDFAEYSALKNVEGE